MRTLIVVRELHPSAGGPPRVVVGQALELKKRGHEPTIVTTCKPGTRNKIREHWPEVERAGVGLYLLERDGPEKLGFSFEAPICLQRLVKNADVVHIHGVWSMLVSMAAAAARLYSVPYIIATHGMLDEWSLSRSKTKKLIARKLAGIESALTNAAGIQFGTEEERDEATGFGLPEKTFVIPNGVDVEKLTRVKNLGRDKLLTRLPGLADRQRILLFFSRIHPKKGIDILLDGFADVVAEHPDVGLLVAGIREDTAYEKQIRERVKHPDLDGRVFVTTDFIGQEGKVAINVADAFVLTARDEGFSMAIIEAMAYGFPILISDKCHMARVEEIGAGFVVGLDKEAVSNGLRRLLALDQQQIREMGERGRNWVDQNYSWSEVGRKILSMYSAIGARNNTQ